MGAWAAFEQFLGKREPLLALMDDPFIQLDKSAATTRLKLHERGGEQGKLELPAAGMATLDTVETDIITHVLEHYARAQVDAANSIRAYDSRLADLALLSRLSSIAAAASKAVSDFKAEIANTTNHLSNSRDAISSSYGELRAFRQQHGLSRPAHAVPPHISTIGQIVLAWLMETAINTFLLRLNDANGVFGGAMAAGAIGAINVGAAAFVGRQVWPQTNRRNVAAKLLAWLGVALWVLGVFVWNLLAAHYRDAKVLGLPNPEKQALGMLGMGLESIYSWGLLAAGIIFAFLAARAGFRMDDPHPGYGEVTQRHDQRCKDYAQDVVRATEGLKDIRDEAIEEASSIQEELSQQLGERKQILTARSAFVRRYDEFGTQLEQVANSLLQDYRNANLTARSRPAPSHFNDRWTLPRNPLPPAGVFDVGESDVRAAEISLAQAVADITAAFDRAIERLEPLDTLKQRLENG